MIKAFIIIYMYIKTEYYCILITSDLHKVTDLVAVIITALQIYNNGFILC